MPALQISPAPLRVLDGPGTTRLRWRVADFIVYVDHGFPPLYVFHRSADRG